MASLLHFSILTFSKTSFRISRVSVFSCQTFKIRPRGYKTFFSSTQLSMNFQLLIKTKMLKNKTFLAFKLADVLFIMLISVKMPSIVGILTFLSRINFVLS